MQRSSTVSPIGDPISWLSTDTLGGTAMGYNNEIVTPILSILQLTFKTIRLLTGGGTSFLAMHKKAPISFLLTRCSTRNSPKYSVTANRNIATFSTGTHATSLLAMALYSSLHTHFLMSFDMEWFSIFSSPKNGGLGFPSGVANQCGIFVLIDSDVWACLFQLDVRGYLRIQWHINLVQNTSVVQYYLTDGSAKSAFWPILIYTLQWVTKSVVLRNLAKMQIWFGLPRIFLPNTWMQPNSFFMTAVLIWHM